MAMIRLGHLTGCWSVFNGKICCKGELPEHVYVFVQTELNLVNLLERALESLTRNRSQAKATEKGAQLPASQSDAEGLMGSALLLILAVSCSSDVCACLL